MGSPGDAADNARPFRDVRRRLAGVLMADDIPDPRDIMIISLADACALWRGLIDEPGRSRLAPRIERIVKMDLIGQAVARVMDETPRILSIGAAFRAPR